MVLIFSVKYDYSTSNVIQWLNSYGIKAIRMNGDDDVYKFYHLSEEGIYFENTLTKEIINLDDATACWWRRTGIKGKHLSNEPQRNNLTVDEFDLSSLIGGSNSYIKREEKDLIEYIHYRIYKTCSINLGKPVFDLNRLTVLDIAKRNGLAVPKYEIITSGTQLKKSKNTLGGIVTKAISNGIQTDIQGHRFYTYTELVSEDFYHENADNVFFPSMITGLIEKKFEIRSFYINGSFFSMAIFSQNSEKTKIDFRKYADNRREPFKLPREIEIKLHNVFIELDLNCGSIDIIVDNNGNYVFLEINPVGQFGMTSDPCNYNLEKLVANFLINGNKNH